MPNRLIIFVPQRFIGEAQSYHSKRSKRELGDLHSSYRRKSAALVAIVGKASKLYQQGGCKFLS
jgi:hypothetical protein